VEILNGVRSWQKKLYKKYLNRLRKSAGNTVRELWFLENGMKIKLTSFVRPAKNCHIEISIGELDVNCEVTKKYPISIDDDDE
jgi:hypothetical protein